MRGIELMCEALSGIFLSGILSLEKKQARSDLETQGLMLLLPGLASSAAYIGPFAKVAPDARRAQPYASLASAIDDSLRSKFNPADIQRVIGSWRRMAAGEEHDAPLPGGSTDPMMRQQANSYIDGLPVTLFHDATQHSWARELEAHAHVVEDEFCSVIEGGELERRGNNVWIGLGDIRDETTVAYGPEWRTLGLLDRGVWDPVNTKLFPRTTALLHDSGTPCVEAFFAKMPAETSIQAHSDGCNFHLTSHLGIVVPEGKCWLKVGEEQVCGHRSGRLLLCDTRGKKSGVERCAVGVVQDRIGLGQSVGDGRGMWGLRGRGEGVGPATPSCVVAAARPGLMWTVHACFAAALLAEREGHAV